MRRALIAVASVLVFVASVYGLARYSVWALQAGTWGWVSSLAIVCIFAGVSGWAIELTTRTGRNHD
jgi:hypothetical protein